MKKYLLLLFTAPFFMGCHSNPYDGIKKRMTPEPVKPKPIPSTGNFTCDLPSSVDLIEGTDQALTLNCRVPAGDPIVSYDNLPDWAQPDPANPAILHVTPKIGDAIDPNRPTERIRKYEIGVVLTSKSVDHTVSRQTLVVLVHHSAQGVTIGSFDPNVVATEGNLYSAAFSVSSPDFPHGPFYVSGTDLPAGVVIASTSDPAVFQISYEPSADTVKAKHGGHRCYDYDLGAEVACLELPWKLNVVDPSGQMASVDADWSVRDRRQVPTVIYPKGLQAPLTGADFYVQVEDANGEVIPQVDSLLPDDGQITVTPVAQGSGSDKQNPYVMVHVVWSNLSDASKGQTKTMTLKTCVYDTYARMNQCTNTTIDVQFQ